MYATLESLGIDVKILPAFVMHDLHQGANDGRKGYRAHPARDLFQFASPTNRRNSYDEAADNSETEEPDFDQYEAYEWDGPLTIHVGERLKSHISENWVHETKYGNEQEVSNFIQLI